MNGGITALDFAIEQLGTSLVDSLKFKSRIAYLLFQRIFYMSCSHIWHNKIFTTEGKVINFVFQSSNIVHVSKSMKFYFLAEILTLHTCYVFTSRFQILVGRPFPSHSFLQVHSLHLLVKERILKEREKKIHFPFLVS